MVKTEKGGGGRSENLPPEQKIFGIGKSHILLLFSSLNTVHWNWNYLLIWQLYIKWFYLHSFYLYPFKLSLSLYYLKSYKAIILQ